MVLVSVLTGNQGPDLKTKLSETVLWSYGIEPFSVLFFEPLKNHFGLIILFGLYPRPLRQRTEARILAMQTCK